MNFLMLEFKRQTESLERLVHRERAASAEVLDKEKDKIIGNLRRDLNIKREYMVDLEERVKEIED